MKPEILRKKRLRSETEKNRESVVFLIRLLYDGTVTGGPEAAREG